MPAAAFSKHSPERTHIAKSFHDNIDPVSSAQRLPGGACGYRELNLGHACGCRRFLINLTLNKHEGVGSASTAAGGGGHLWCYCGHHACFHARNEHIEERMTIQQEDTGAAHLRHDTPIELEPVLRHHQRHSFPFGTPSSVAAAVRLSQAYHIHDPPASSKLEQPRQLNNSPSPISLGLPRTGVNSKFIDAVRSPTELATPSTSMIGSPEIRATEAAFHWVGQGLQQYSSLLDGTRCSSSLAERNRADSVTRSSPAQSVVHAPILNERLLTQITSLKAILLGVPNMSTSLSGLAQRLDALETTSFGHGPVEELLERYEHVDGRLLDVEGRLEELERLCESALSPDSRHGSSQDGQYGDEVRLSIEDSYRVDETRSMDGSAIRTTTVRPVMDPSTSTRLEQLERRLSRFEASALPSPGNPWEIEVVLLPWGRKLKGLWCTDKEFSQMSVPSSRESESLPATTSHQSAPYWSTSQAEHPLYARACGPTKGIYGRIYERLKSRGFVSNITITGNSARELEFELMWALESQLRALKDERRAGRSHPQTTTEPLAFSNPFIPLCKVHKSSRLHFLTSAELATPSLWTAEFLNASVFMKAPVAGKRRLFITHPAAYLQSQDTSRDWTWQRLRELPRVKLRDRGNASVDLGIEADALERCWTEDARLDPPLSATSSFAWSSGSAFGSSIASPPPSPQQPVRQLPRRSSLLDQTAPPAGLQTVYEAREGPPPPITPVSQYEAWAHDPSALGRTSSVPIATIEDTCSTSSIAKRHPASFDDVYMRFADDNHNGAAPYISKRRRLSKTPSGDCIRSANWGYTPRLSREPPSPGVPIAQMQFRPQHRPLSGQSNIDGTSERGRRMVTPSAYATPFSYTVGGDTDIDESDSDGDGDGESDVDGSVITHTDIDAGAGVGAGLAKDNDVHVEDLDLPDVNSTAHANTDAATAAVPQEDDATATAEADADVWGGVDEEEEEDEELFKREFELSMS